MSQSPEQPRPEVYGAPPAYLPPEHPQATLALVLGVLGIVACGVLSPVAWYVGGRAVAEIDASGGRVGGRGAAHAGRVLGIVGTVLIGLAVLALVLLLVMFAVLGLGVSMSD